MTPPVIGILKWDIIVMPNNLVLELETMNNMLQHYNEMLYEDVNHLRGTLQIIIATAPHMTSTELLQTLQLLLDIKK